MSGTESLQGLAAEVGPRLKLRWLTDPPPDPVPLRPDKPGSRGHNLVGSLNCIHPNRIQVVGHAELVYLADIGAAAFGETLQRLFDGAPAAIVFSDGIQPEACFFDWAARQGTPLLGTSLGDEDLIDRLQFYLTSALAERVTLHGVFLEVLGMGVLLDGEAAIGKSELALELITRGHRLVADDAPEFARTTPGTLDGSCPALLRDFLEVRGLGVLNIRAMFGETAVRQRKNLNLIVKLRMLNAAELQQIDRLGGSLSAHNVLGVAVPEITMPVAPGRNLAILVEAAVRQQILRERGYEAGVDFAERQARAIGAQAGLPGTAAP